MLRGDHVSEGVVYYCEIFGRERGFLEEVVEVSHLIAVLLHRTEGRVNWALRCRVAFGATCLCPCVLCLFYSCLCLCRK